MKCSKIKCRKYFGIVARYYGGIKEYLGNLQTFSSLFNVWIQRLVAVLAFWPHKPSYDLIGSPRLDGHGQAYTICLNEKAKKILHSYKFYRYQTLVDTKQKEGLIVPFVVTTSRGNRVFCLKIDYTNHISRKPLDEYNQYSVPHSNGCDLGIIIGSLWRLAKKCKCTVVAYDYSGYGRSTGKPSERNIYADIEAVAEALVEKFRIPTHSLILYGESIGSAPALNLAARLWVAGVILHAPLMSGIRTFYNYGKRSWLFDPFPNIDTIRFLDKPVLIIHGMRDTIIDISHGIRLYHNTPLKVRPLWLKQANHNDIRVYPPYFRRIQFFFKECDRANYHH